MSTTGSSEMPTPNSQPTTPLSDDPTTNDGSKSVDEDNKKEMIGAEESPLISIPESSNGVACLCKGYHVRLIAEKEIRTAHYRLEMGTIPLLDEANPMESAKERASKDIMAAAQDDLHLIVEEKDVPCTHSKAMESGMKEWMKYHFQWRCDGAERQFNDMMRHHPKREDRSKSKAKRDAGRIITKQRRIEALGGEEKTKEIDAKRGDDWRGSRISMGIAGFMPYPGCQCLLWGATIIGDKAHDAVMASYDDAYPITTPWVNTLMAAIGEAQGKALDDIRDIIAGQVPKYCSATWMSHHSTPEEQNPRDHFPMWQQALVMESIKNAADKVEILIKANKGTGGEEAKAEEKKAEHEYRVYRDKRYAEWKERESEKAKAVTASAGELDVREKLAGLWKYLGF